MSFFTVSYLDNVKLELKKQNCPQVVISSEARNLLNPKIVAKYY